MSSSPHTPDTPLAAESRERQSAQERARAAASGHGPPREPGLLAQRAFVALAEQVRDYAVFLMEPDGTICFWGESARLMQWWMREQAEGSHLRLLYPDGGSEDGTAEAHLQLAAADGEYVGEGRRVRGDGSTFWGGVTLTALRDAGGALLGFTQVMRNLTARRSADAALTLALVAHAARETAIAEASAAREERDAAQERLEYATEQVRSARVYAREVLERNIKALVTENVAALKEMAELNAEVERLGRDRGRTGVAPE